MDGVCDGMMNMGIGQVAKIPQSFKWVKTSRKELMERKMSMIIYTIEHDEAVARATVAKELM